MLHPGGQKAVERTLDQLYCRRGTVGFLNALLRAVHTRPPKAWACWLQKSVYAKRSVSLGEGLQKPHSENAGSPAEPAQPLNVT